MFKYRGLPRWLGIYNDSLILHSDSTVYLYNLTSSTLFTKNVIPVISYYNTIKGSILYITSGN